MPLAQHENRFKKTSLARTVRSTNQVKTGIKIERRALQVSEICQAKLTDGHIARASYLLQSHWHHDIKAVSVSMFFLY